MRNGSPAFGFLTQNSSQAPSEMSKKGIRVRYPGVMILLSIVKSTVHMN